MEFAAPVMTVFLPCGDDLGEQQRTAMSSTGKAKVVNYREIGANIRQLLGLRLKKETFSDQYINNARSSEIHERLVRDEDADRVPSASMYE